MELLAGFLQSAPYAEELARSFVGSASASTEKRSHHRSRRHVVEAGLVGEVGADAISWQQEHHTQTHGLYQQMLGNLADCGVLLGVCSKNEPSIVQAALARKDLYLDAESLFPVCRRLGAKIRIRGQDPACVEYPSGLGCFYR